jgi:glycosyltransferase involved in cell wall biosynthesis
LKYEIIVVDDKSTDGSVKILNAFDDKIKLIKLEENLGLASAANAGIKQAQGRLIVRVDADDYVHEDFLKLFIIANEQLGNEYDVFSMDYLEVDNLGNMISRKDATIYPIACGLAIKQEVFYLIGGYTEGLRINEDLDLYNKILSLNKSIGAHKINKKNKLGAKNIYNLNIPLYRYVKHGTSLTDRIFR